MWRGLCVPGLTASPETLVIRNMSRPAIGATTLPNGRTHFRVWAPQRKSVALKLSTDAKQHSLTADAHGFFSATFSDVPEGTAYSFILDGELERPDPASRSQLDGVQGPSRVVDLTYPWHDLGWSGVPLRKYIIYEVHVGTFSQSGTFAALIPELQRLKALGLTAIELMPVAQFPGGRNWGYDGVYPFAVQDSYGGPRELQRLVDECHRVGLAVVLDVVYNHFGPEGCYLADFGPYFTDAYQTPWGKAINFDGPENGAVREFFIHNAMQWVRDFHVDALRLDAVHAIFDRSAVPFLEVLSDEVSALSEELGRKIYLIAESDLNDPRVVTQSQLGGLGLDSMWCDDFHHAAHTLLTGERAGYYADFGKLEDLARAFRYGMSHAGHYSKYRKRRHGREAVNLDPKQCVVCIQNHDQVGNRLLGERLTALIEFETQKLAAGLVCLAPFLPLLFMGQEYAEVAPFQYWVSHEDPELLEAVRQGRRREFSDFGHLNSVPDPAAKETFDRCVLDHQLRHAGDHAVTYRLYHDLLELRAQVGLPSRVEAVTFEQSRVLLVQKQSRFWLAFSFASLPVQLRLPVAAGSWIKLIASADADWSGPGPEAPLTLESRGELEISLPPQSFVLYSLQGRAS